MVDIKWLIKWPEVVVVVVMVVYYTMATCVMLVLVSMATCQKHFPPGSFGFTAFPFNRSLF